MALNDAQYLIAEIERESIEEILLGLGKAANPYLYRPLPDDASLENFFGAFTEGHRELRDRHFFAQTRVRPPTGNAGGRILVSYRFDSKDDLEGTLRVSVSDNGEDVPQDLFDEVFSTLKKYVLEQGLLIIEEDVKPEY